MLGNGNDFESPIIPTPLGIHPCPEDILMNPEEWLSCSASAPLIPNTEPHCCQKVYRRSAWKLPLVLIPFFNLEIRMPLFESQASLKLCNSLLLKLSLTVLYSAFSLPWFVALIE